MARPSPGSRTPGRPRASPRPRPSRRASSATRRPPTSPATAGSSRARRSPTSSSTDSQAAADVAAARAVAAERQAAAAAAEISVAQAGVGAAEAVVKERQSDLDYARLERSYATLTAPIDGLVSQKDVEVGQYVQSGQTLMSISADADTWIVANYKETQIADIHPGEPAEFTVDGYPGRVFRGRVDSLAGATGARFSLLPPDNASGNFVKVTQRVPVKITIDPAPGQPFLRAGLSVDVAVATEAIGSGRHG